VRIALATRSLPKAREIRMILPRSVELLSLDDLAIPPDPAEDDLERFTTFRENALAKAHHFAALTGLPTLADDSGICVAALGGRPGVHSKRFAPPDAPGADRDDANNRHLLRLLDAVPHEERTARYLCAAALALPAGPSCLALGACAGTILPAPRGTGGFGYDPYFFLPHLGATFAELPPDHKNRLSHRARACRALAPQLATWLRSAAPWNRPQP
jgi:XTP/dITP diphosphohydrolase